MLTEMLSRMRKRMRPPAAPAEPFEALCDRLLSQESVSMKLRLAGEILARFADSDDQGKREFLTLLAGRYDADPARLAAAIARYQRDQDAGARAELHAVSEPRRQQILRQLNQVPGGTAMLVAMRRDALRIGRDISGFEAMDADFAHLFSSWFNGGFLTLRQLDWSSSGAVLTKLMDYEAVHAIESWEALRARVEPSDRRCYAFFHPQMADEPLIFVEVALTSAIPTSIGEILRLDRPVIAAKEASAAIFYSISNCQEGLRGIPFGGPLLKQVVDVLRRELPGLRQTMTLSPMPGFARWLAKSEADRALAARLAEPGWHEDPVEIAGLSVPLTRAAARYLMTAEGREADPVARFHLGNGARVERLVWLGDASAKGLRQSHGMMVNYLYDSAYIDANYRAYAERRTIAASGAVRRLAKDEGGMIPLPRRAARWAGL